MTTLDRTWQYDDRDLSPGGPWVDEPDKAQWIDAATGLDCLIVRNGGGALCGYVGVPKEHPWHGKEYGECLTGCGEEFCYGHSPGSSVRVHGGLTFSDRCRPSEKGEGVGICHVPASGRPDDLWWFGFDCAHDGDYMPARSYQSWVFRDGEYRDVPYVMAECARLAAQLSQVAAS